MKKTNFALKTLNKHSVDIMFPVLFLIALLIQLIYHGFIFTKLIEHRDYDSFEPQANYPPVTVIVAAYNELANLQRLIPQLLSQDYPYFEILVADDRSSDGTQDYLIELKQKHPRFEYLRLEEIPKHFTAKKFAITMAIKKAKHEMLLFTDADCYPNSDYWIRQMVAQKRPDKEIALGFSPYEVQKGSLNALIRYETFQTAVQYLSFALAKVPFMGVGRNLMYNRDVFWRNNGFSKHHSLLSGDDDLFINQVATAHNVVVSTDSRSYMYSIPEKTWKNWFYQKRRHLSVGKKYKIRDRINLGLLWISQIGYWLLLIPTFLASGEWFQSPEWVRIPVDLLKQYNLKDLNIYTDWMRLVTGVFVGFIIIKWLILAKCNKKLGGNIRNRYIPYYDFLFTGYLIIFGLVTIFTSPKKIKWY